MKIVQCNVVVVWDNGDTEDISYHLPEGIVEQMEDYLDLLEREENESNQTVSQTE